MFMNDKSLILDKIERDLSMLFEIRKKYRPLVNQKRLISIASPTRKPEYMCNIFENYMNQSYPNKELIVVLNNNSMNYNEWLDYSKRFPDVRIYQLDESVSLGECLNFAVKNSNGDYIAKLDDDDHYGVQYLFDMLTYFYCTEASIIGKTSVFIFFEALKQLYLSGQNSFDYVLTAFGGTQVIKREVFDEISYQALNVSEDRNFLQMCTKKGFKIYSGDPFNYTYMRHANYKNNTWGISDLDYVKLFGFQYVRDGWNAEDLILA